MTSKESMCPLEVGDNANVTEGVISHYPLLTKDVHLASKVQAQKLGTFEKSAEVHERG